MDVNYISFTILLYFQYILTFLSQYSRETNRKRNHSYTECQPSHLPIHELFSSPFTKI